MEQIITMLWGLITFSKSLFNEKLHRDGNVSRNSGKNKLDIWLCLSTRLLYTDSLQPDEFDAMYSVGRQSKRSWKINVFLGTKQSQ